MTTTIQTATNITLTTAPTLEHMKIWWAELQSDPTRDLVYTDFRPHDLDEFLEAVDKAEITVWMFLVHEDDRTRVGGVFYQHDTGMDAGGPYTWFGIYIMPPFRGSVAAWAWQAIHQQWMQQGFNRIFAAIRHSNRAAQRFITQKMGFTRLGVYTDWSYFQGSMDAVVLYTKRPQDQGLSWVLAEQRAQRVRILPPPVHRDTRQLRVAWDSINMSNRI